MATSGLMTVDGDGVLAHFQRLDSGWAEWDRQVGTYVAFQRIHLLAVQVDLGIFIVMYVEAECTVGRNGIQFE